MAEIKYSLQVTKTLFISGTVTQRMCRRTKGISPEFNVSIQSSIPDIGIRTLISIENYFLIELKLLKLEEKSKETLRARKLT